MSQALHFETPENVKVKYVPAGLGSRFLAWFVDQLILTLFFIVIVIAIILSWQLLKFPAIRLAENFDSVDFSPEQLVAIIFGVIILVKGFLSFLYYGISELIFRGQTLGKRYIGVRVIKTDGFSLDPGSILVRNVFRLIDDMPITWIVPFLSAKSLRLGDMVAGTAVVDANKSELSEIRAVFSDRKSVDAEFRFDATAISKLSTQDVQLIEGVIERWTTIQEPQRTTLVERVVRDLSQKMSIDEPIESKRLTWLEDLFAAEIRRQNRSLNF